MDGGRLKERKDGKFRQQCFHVTRNWASVPTQTTLLI